MSPEVIEGTWEEIESHKAELMGRHLRVIVMPEEASAKEPSATAEAQAPAKVLTGYGMFAGLISTEDYLREKRADTIREDRDLYDGTTR